MYYAQADSHGNIIAYYSDEFVYLNGIPAEAIPITDEQWSDSVKNPGKYIIQNGQLVLAPPPSDDELLAQAKQAKLMELQTACQAAINAMYTDPTVTDIVTAINNCRAAFFQRQQQVQNATTLDEVNAVSTTF